MNRTPHRHRRELRKRKLLSLEYAASVAGVCASTVQAWETGRTRDPRTTSGEGLQRLAKVLDVTVEEYTFGLEANHARR